MKVSVITINLNGNRYLPEALQSILTQDYLNIELIVVDGASSDGSLDTIRNLATKDDRIRWISEPDQGISDAMNKGISMVTGDVAAFIHADDLYPAKNILSQVVKKFLVSPDAVWLTGGMEMIDERGRVLRTFPVRRYSVSRLVRSNILFHPATFVRTGTLRDCGMFDPSLKLAMDYDLWLRLATFGPPLTIDQPLASFRVHEGSRSIQAADAALMEEFAIRKRYLDKAKKNIWPYALHQLVKRLANAVFVRGLRHSNE